MNPRYYALVCDEFPERKATLQAHLKERGVRATYVRGFHGKTWGLDTTLEYEPGKRLPAGHVALNLGAWSMWMYAHLDTGRKDVDPCAPVIFFEDDVELCADWDARLREVLTELPDDWELVFVGLAECEPGVWHKIDQRFGRPDSPICRLRDPFGTHALMVKPHAIPILLENMREARRNLDQQLWQNVLQRGKLNWYAVLPTLVKQRTFDYTGGDRPEWASVCGVSTAREQAAAQEDKSRYIDSLALIDPHPCIYRGEPFHEHGRATAQVRKSVPVNECARLNVACHSRPAGWAVSHESGPVRACEVCELRADMQPAPRRRTRLPLPDGHFNPSISLYRGRLILATRDSWGHSKVGLWELTNSAADWTGEWAVKPLASLASKHPEATRLEDPRLFVGRDRLLCAFNLPDGYPPKVVQVGYALFAPDLRSIEDTHVFRSPRDSVYEKNWVPTEDFHWIYAMKPNHIVLDEDGKTTWSTPNNLPWTGGVMRGGAVPIKWREGYISFFHGCLKRTFGNVYTMGAYTFEGRPPYRILKQTATPLAWPDLPAEDESVVKRFVLWPGGVVAHAGAFHVALGIDDSFCRIQRFPFEVVEAALQDVPEENGVIQSIRDTPIAMGVRRRDP